MAEPSERSDRPAADETTRALRQLLRERLGPPQVIEDWLATPLADFDFDSPMQVLERGPDGPAILLEYIRRYGI